MNHDLLTILIVVLVVVVIPLMTFRLWHDVNRPKYKQLNKKFRKALWESGPIEPKHDKPKLETLRNLDEYEAKFFQEFDDFADVMNWWLAVTDPSPWRLQELPDTYVGTTVGMRGRTYAVFYNQVRLGKLETYPFGSYGRTERTIWTNLKLDNVRLLAYYGPLGFLDDLALHVVNNNPQSDEYVAARNAINQAMVKALWDNYQISRADIPASMMDWGELELHLHGTPTWYFERRDGEAIR